MTCSPQLEPFKRLGCELIDSVLVDYAHLINVGAIRDGRVHRPFHEENRYTTPELVQELIDFLHGDGIELVVEFFALRKIDPDLIKEVLDTPAFLKRYTRK